MVALVVFLVLVCAPSVMATTYYVAKTSSSDANTCVQAQSAGTAKLTINGGAGCLNAGDTLIVKAGNYTETLINALPSGTAGSPTILQSEVQRGAVMFTDTIGTNEWCTICLRDRSYITIDGMVLDGSNSNHVAHVYLNGTNHHIVIQNNEIRYGTGHCTYTDNPMGIATNTDQSFITVTGNSIHDISRGVGSGCAFYGYGMYFHANDSLIENNEIYNNAGFGIHGYNAISQTGEGTRTVIRNNSIHHNGLDSGESGVLFASGGNDNLFYNNLVYANAANGIQVDGYGVGSNNNKLYNNTFYANGGNCIQLGAGGSGSPSNTIIRNNICYGNGNDIINSSGDTHTVQDHNLLGTNPLFVDAAASDFHLQIVSPAIDAGVTWSAVVGSDTFSSSYQGPAPDMGALEFTPSVAPPSPAAFMFLFR